MLAYYNDTQKQLSPAFSSVRAGFAWGRDEGFPPDSELRHTDERDCTLEEVQEWLYWLDYLKYGDEDE